MTDYLNLINKINTPILLINKVDWRIAFLNPVAAQWTGAVIGLQLIDIMPEINYDKISTKVNRGRDAIHTQIVNIHPNFNAAFKFTNFSNEYFLVEGIDHSILDESKAMLSSYSKIIEKKNHELSKERDEVEKLLFNILPKKAVEELKMFGITKPEKFDNLSILFLDFVGFTKITTQLDPVTLFNELNDLFHNFDEITYEHGCERIKTIGDAYLAVSGLNNDAISGIRALAAVSIKMIDYLVARNLHNTNQWQCRIGINVGPVVAGIIGKKKYIYDIFGDGVNTAARIESYSEPMKINSSRSVYELLLHEYLFTPRGFIEVKGKGSTEMFFLEEPKPKP